MDASREPEARILCLGNDLLADDAVGLEVARRLEAAVPSSVEVVRSMESGLHLLDYFLGVPQVVVVDAIETGTVPPGTVLEFDLEDVDPAPGSSPHTLGLFDAHRIARELDLPVAERLDVICVEIADTRTMGADLHPAVAGAIPEMIERVQDLLAKGGRPCTN
jgi:hydrogenase maturation protease